MVTFIAILSRMGPLHQDRQGYSLPLLLVVSPQTGCFLFLRLAIHQTMMPCSLQLAYRQNCWIRLALSQVVLPPQQTLAPSFSSLVS